MSWFKKTKVLGEKLYSVLEDVKTHLTTSTERNPDKCLDPSTYSKKMESKRPMKYPYTISAKMAQFPLRYYMTHVWMWKYYFLAVGLSMPLFYKIGKLSQSPENVAKWNEIRRKEFSGGHH